MGGGSSSAPPIPTQIRGAITCVIFSPSDVEDGGTTTPHEKGVEGWVLHAIEGIIGRGGASPRIMRGERGGGRRCHYGTLRRQQRQR